MATMMELRTKYAKLPAFRGIVGTDIDSYIELALEAVEAYAPKKVILKGIPSNSSGDNGLPGGRYYYPEGAKNLLAAFVENTNIEIEMRADENPRDADTPTVDGRSTYDLLQIKVPSTIDLLRDEGMAGYQNYPTPFASGYRYATFTGSGYESHDLVYTVPLTIDMIRETRQLMALRLYAESKAYEFQATKTSSLSDITDREASGASTTIRRSQSGNAFQKLSERYDMDFKREVARPYWCIDTFGLTQFLWSEHRL